MDSPGDLGFRSKMSETRDRVAAEEYEVEKIIGKKYNYEYFMYSFFSSTEPGF
jgi:hypothetical protein